MSVGQESGNQFTHVPQPIKGGSWTALSILVRGSGAIAVTMANTWSGPFPQSHDLFPVSGTRNCPLVPSIWTGQAIWRLRVPWSACHVFRRCSGPHMGGLSQASQWAKLKNGARASLQN